MSHPYQLRSTSAKKTSGGQLPTGNNNQINSNEFSHYNSYVLAIDNSENEGPPGDRWQDHSLGMETNNNSSFMADQNDEGIDNIYYEGFNLNIYSKSTLSLIPISTSIGFNPLTSSSFNSHLSSNIFLANTDMIWAPPAETTSTVHLPLHQQSRHEVYLPSSLSLLSYQPIMTHPTLVSINPQRQIVPPVYQQSSQPQLPLSYYQEVPIIHVSSTPLAFNTDIMVGNLQQEASTVLLLSVNFPMFGPPSLSSSTLFPDSPMRRSPKNVRTFSSDQLLANSQVASMQYQPSRPTVFHPTVAAQPVYVPAPNRFNTRPIVSHLPSPPISSASSSFTVPSLSTFSANQLPDVLHGSAGPVTHDPFLSDVTVTEDETNTTDINFDSAFDSADSSSLLFLIPMKIPCLIGVSYRSAVLLLMFAQAWDKCIRTISIKRSVIPETQVSSDLTDLLISRKLLVSKLYLNYS